MLGVRSGKLVVVERAGKLGRLTAWKCECDCGTTVIRTGTAIRQGRASCGCGRMHAVTHGMSRSGVYMVWAAMKARCSNRRNRFYPEYGGRGIKVCRRWMDSFESFIDDMGDRPPGMTIDRIDNNGDYCPANCRWATQSENARNRRSTRMLSHGGRSMCVSDWADATGISKRTILARLRYGWSIERTLTSPVG